jgi:hypothetical protein
MPVPAQLNPSHTTDYSSLYFFLTYNRSSSCTTPAPITAPFAVLNLSFCVVVVVVVVLFPG